MQEQKFCDQCNQKQSCQNAFRQLGNIQGKSVVRNVLVAFALPLLVFIGALIVAQQLLGKHIESVGLRTAFALLLAFAAVAVCVAVSRSVGRRIGKN